jgi:hypothetical protein
MKGVDVFMEAKQILESWLRVVRAGDLDAVVGMYAAGSVLLPTFSPRRVATPEGLRRYFSALFAREQLSVELHEEALRIIAVGKDAYTLIGIYSFAFAVDGSVLTFPSRFTFVVDTAREAPILHHHSSQVPRTLE